MFSSINLVKGVKESFGAKTFMARAAIDVRPFSNQPGKPIDKWYDLGKNDWSHEEGTVSYLQPCPLPPEVWQCCWQERAATLNTLQTWNVPLT